MGLSRRLARQRTNRSREKAGNPVRDCGLAFLEQRRLYIPRRKTEGMATPSTLLPPL